SGSSSSPVKEDKKSKIFLTLAEGDSQSFHIRKNNHQHPGHELGCANYALLVVALKPHSHELH
ncbi:hypothetical protein EVAR_101388_1, partial [Eumeta japonica]